MQGPLRKLDVAGASARVVRPSAGLIWASFQPNTVHYFRFSFSAKLREFIENSRKMLKI